jgi:hypothetical protein
LKSNVATTTSSLPAAPKPEGVPSSPEKVASSTTTPAAAAATTTTESAMTKPTMNAPSTTSPSFSPYELSDHQYHHWRLEEDRIRLIRQALPTHRLNSNIQSNKRNKNVDSNTTKKKRKRESFEYYKPASIPGWRASAPKELNPDQEEDWKAAMVAAEEKVEGWMDHYRLCRQSYWDEQKDDKPQGVEIVSSFYMPQERTEQKRCCKLCVSKPHGDPYWDGKQHKNESKKRRAFSGDDLMQCLECSFIGCSPKSLAPDSRQHILQHLLLTGHTFGKYCWYKADFWEPGIVASLIVPFLGLLFQRCLVGNERSCFAFDVAISSTTKPSSRKRSGSTIRNSYLSWLGKNTQSSVPLTHFNTSERKIMGLFGGDSLRPIRHWFQRSIFVLPNSRVGGKHSLKVESIRSG